MLSANTRWSDSLQLTKITGRLCVCVCVCRRKHLFLYLCSDSVTQWATSWTVGVFLTKAAQLKKTTDNIWSDLMSANVNNPKSNITLIVFLWGCYPVLVIVLLSAARRIWTFDLDLWAAVTLGSRLQAQPARCSVISALSEQRKKKKWEHCDQQRCDQSLIGSYCSVGTYNCKGLWEMGTFYCFSSNHLLICLPSSASCPHSCFCSIFNPSHLPSILQSILQPHF